MIDLDHAATTPLLPEVRAAMTHALAANVGNPSSVHGRGQAARALVERARAQVAGSLGVRPLDVLWTSGATEANALALRGLLREGDGLVLTAVEHPSVRAVAAALAAEGVRTREVAVDAQGRLQLDDLAVALAEPGVRLVSVMAVNNELGGVLPVAEAVRLARQHGVLVHCDATQALGRIPVSPAAWDVDLLSVSAHKIGGPTGAGALWVRRGVPLRALQVGHQEQGLRAGTENLLGVVGFGAAAAHLPRRLAAAGHVRSLRDRLWQGLREIPGARRNGERESDAESGHILHVSFADVPGATLVMALDLEGVAVSAGSACSAGTLEPSHVLLACGDRQRAVEGVRLSLGPETTEAEVAQVVALVPAVVARVRAVVAPGESSTFTANADPSRRQMP
jgi:cysteine desulfurase